MRLVTWNINSVRLRLNLVERLTTLIQPDVLCLQETKVTDELFPADALKDMGYSYQAIRGEKSYNGVAILSKKPFTVKDTLTIANESQARHISVSFDGGTELHNFYIPAGGDEPDVALNPKYAYKLAFVEWVTQFFNQHRTKTDRIIAVGDFNIAPREHDVWSHTQLRNVVSHTEPEITRLNAMQSSFDWVDVGRHFVPDSEKLYSWWSYRNRDWKKSNRGRRLDHVWVTQPLQDSLKSYSALTEARDWEKPSDHVPLIVELG